MANDSAIYHNEMVMNSDWPFFLANLAQSCRGRPAAIEQDGDLLLQKLPGQEEPLQGIELRSGHKEQQLIIITADQTYTILAPNIIWTVRNEQEELVAVEILDTQEHRFIMRFISDLLG